MSGYPFGLPVNGWEWLLLGICGAIYLVYKINKGSGNE